MSEDGRKIIQEVRNIAAAHPTKVYRAEKCRYMYGKRPSCLIGRALFSLGHLPSSSEGIENKPAGIAISQLGIALDARETNWLNYAQLAQDGNAGIGRGRYTWSEAVKLADAKVALG